jgi:hypothetical protein
MAKIIRVNGIFEEDFKQEPSLEEMQGVVGGYIEAVHILDVPGKVMIVNEEGRLKHLPLNIKASTMARQEIVGDVLVCEETSDGRLI